MGRTLRQESGHGEQISRGCDWLRGYCGAFARARLRLLSGGGDRRVLRPDPGQGEGARPGMGARSQDLHRLQEDASDREARLRHRRPSQLPARPRVDRRAEGRLPRPGREAHGDERRRSQGHAEGRGKGRQEAHGEPEPASVPAPREGQGNPRQRHTGQGSFCDGHVRSRRPGELE